MTLNAVKKVSEIDQTKMQHTPSRRDVRQPTWILRVSVPHSHLTLSSCDTIDLASPQDILQQEQLPSH